MTLPPPFANETLRAIEASMDGEPLKHLESLRADDLKLIGAFIQTFNFVEFNLRRAVSVFIHAGLLAPQKRILPSKLVSLSVSAVEQMAPTSEETTDTIARLRDIEIRRECRNLLAHWAAKRIRDRDALCLMSHDGQDAIQVNIGPLERSDAGYAILLLTDLRDQVHRIAEHDRWLSRKIAEWYKRYNE